MCFIYTVEIEFYMAVKVLYLTLQKLKCLTVQKVPWSMLAENEVNNITGSA